MRLTRYELEGFAEFQGDSAFRLTSNPFDADIPLGLYELPRRSGEAHLYRLGHPLAQKVLERAKGRELPPVEVLFDLGQHEGKISILESLRGQSGLLALSLFTVESLDQAEDYLLAAALTDSGVALEDEAARRLFALPAHITKELPDGIQAAPLNAAISERQETIQRSISQRNAAFFDAEADKLDGWADDLKIGLEREIKDLDRQIKEARRSAAAALSLEEKLAGQKQVKALESQRHTRRRALFDAQDEIDRRRGQLIEEIEGKLQQRTTLESLFTIRWQLI
jgi:adenine-specific DNA-methyltransferase